MKVKSVILSILVLLGCFGFTGCGENFGIKTVYITWNVYIPNDNVQVYIINDFHNEQRLLEKKKITTNNIIHYEIPYYDEVKTRKNYKASIILLLRYENNEEEIIYPEFLIPYLDSKDGILEKKLSYLFNNQTEEMQIIVNYHFRQTI